MNTGDIDNIRIATVGSKIILDTSKIQLNIPDA